MSYSIDLLRDDFTDGVISPAWKVYPYLSGSAVRSETIGHARITLPSSTVGTHEDAYYSAASYDITSSGAFINVDTMVATGVAAYAFWGFYLGDFNYQLRWFQQSGTLKASSVVNAVTTDHYSVAWNATTYKYLRIRESAGTIYFDSSSNGTTWTNRGTVLNPFAVTALAVIIAAGCGNVASPGTFRVEDFNPILPAPSSTWRETTADWSITNRLRPVTLASDGGKLGVLVTADTMDSSRVLGGTVRYFGGPLGSTSGGYLALTEYASLVLAQASPFPIPIDGRVDLPALVDARYMRLYHRSTDASAHTLREFVPRRIIQADDIEAESIKAINIAAGAITADKIFVLSLAAITANMGTLNMSGFISIASTGGIFQGTGTAAVPTNALKLFNSSGVGKLSSYNAGVEQVTIDTDGKLKWGAGVGEMDAAGIRVNAVSAMADVRAYAFKGASLNIGGLYGSEDTLVNQVRVWGVGNSRAGVVRLHVSSSATYDARIESFLTSGLTTSTPFYASANSTGNVVVTEIDAQAGNGTIRLKSPTIADYGMRLPRSDGNATFALDTAATGFAITLANNATETPFGGTNNFAGMILINETLSFGAVGLFVTGAGLIAEVSDPSARYATTAGTASMINVYMSANVVTIENKTGSTITVNVCGFRNRTSS